MRLCRPAQVDGVQESVSQLRDGLPARGLLRLKIDLSRDPLPPPLRDGGTLTVLDITEYFSDASGGIRTYLLAKAAWVNAQVPCRQVLVFPHHGDSIIEGERSRVYGLQGPRIPLNPQYRLIFSTRTPRRIIEHERPDLIEVGSHLLVPWVTRFANRRARVPVVWFYHGHLPKLIAPDHRSGPVQRLLERWSWAYVRRLARGCRAVLVASRYLERELAAHGVTDVVRVPLGVDVEHFHPRRRARAAYLRGRLGVPEGRVALFAGRYAREKRIEVLLDAWGEVERRTGTRLVLVGGGPGEAGLRRHPYASRVTWLPFEANREVLADLLAAVDLYVAPGPYETFGLSALEAMASGVPVLSVDRGGVAERVQESGAGETYPFDDVDGLVVAAVRLLGRDLPTLGAQARAFAERHHSWDAACAAIFDTYRRLLGR
jgi:alpha-1,6-mannosyltransferase